MVQSKVEIDLHEDREGAMCLLLSKSCQVNNKYITWLLSKMLLQWEKLFLLLISTWIPIDKNISGKQSFLSRVQRHWQPYVYKLMKELWNEGDGGCIHLSLSNSQLFRGFCQQLLKSGVMNGNKSRPCRWGAPKIIHHLLIQQRDETECQTGFPLGIS